MTNMQKMRELIEKIRLYDRAYYEESNPLVSDREYDEIYDQLLALEKETGVVLSNSPTQRPSGKCVDSLKKVKHSKPMLSAEKTKSVEEIKKFIANGLVSGNKYPGQVIVGWKEDGLTIVLRYENGEFVQGITRGDGDYGEDITHNVGRFKNVPMHIPCKDSVEIRGEGVVSLADFEAFNETHDDQFSHARNMASGSVRAYDSNVAAERNISFIAFEVVRPVVSTKKEEYEFLANNGFYVVEHTHTDIDHVEDVMKQYDPKNYAFPVDGLIIEHEDKEFGRSLGATGHHENCRMAFKWANELHETTFLGVEVRTTRTGMVSLTALFKPVMIEGHKVQRATLHNLSFFENLQLGIGDKIQVYKANQIIPEIDRNDTKSNSYVLSMTCPCCGAPLEIHTGPTTGSRTLYCPNPECAAKKSSRFEHFASKPAANIVGLSGSKIGDLLSFGLVHRFADLYHLDPYQSEISALDGWGKRSFEKIQAAIEESRKMELRRFIVCFGIPQVGKNAGKDIHKYFHGDPVAFMDAVKNGFDFHVLPDFGDIMCQNLKEFFDDPENMEDWNTLMKEFQFELDEESEAIESPLTGKSVVATGSFQYFSRNGINRAIEKLGGMPKGAVSKKTDFVVVGENAGSKKDKAKSLNIPILSEQDLMKMFGAQPGDEEKFADRG